jgi:hypothetical protein
MNIYEIRLIRQENKSPDIYASSHISDHAAVRHAQALADDDIVIEVWRGLSCVYSGAPKCALVS